MLACFVFQCLSKLTAGEDRTQTEMNFDWDDANRKHIARHNILPEEAEQVILNDPLELETQTFDSEVRFTQLGETNAGRILVVAVTLRADQVRIITAWDAPQASKRQYLAERQKTWQHLS